MDRIVIALTALLVAAVLYGASILYLDRRETAAELRGMDQERARVAARANQEIATRRERDAEFDKMDARQHCLDAGLEWVFGDDGKSFCR